MRICQTKWRIKQRRQVTIQENKLNQKKKTKIPTARLQFFSKNKAKRKWLIKLKRPLIKKSKR